MKTKLHKILPLPLLIINGVACSPRLENSKLVPAEAYSKAAKAGQVGTFSFNKANIEHIAEMKKELGVDDFKSSPSYQGDPKMLSQGIDRKSVV